MNPGQAMARENYIGLCEDCNKEFAYHLIHNGFNNSSYAYCDKCGMTALLDLFKTPGGVALLPHQIITPEIEPCLSLCACGGSFKATATPRCPNCGQALGAARAADYIEPNAEGTQWGWRWQRTWTGLYCIIINNKVLRDPWKTQRTS